MDAVSYVKALRTFWWIIALWLVVGLGAGFLRNQTATPVWSSSVTFYIGTPSNTGDSSFSNGQFAQARAQTYAQLLESQRLAEAVIASTGVRLTPVQVMGKINGAVPLDTVLVTATVLDTSRERSNAIATGVAEDFATLVDSLDNSGTKRVVDIGVASGPLTRATPVSPKKTVNLGLGGVAGLALGVASALWSSRILDRSGSGTRSSSSGTGTGTGTGTGRDAPAPVVTPREVRRSRDSSLVARETHPET